MVGSDWLELVAGRTILGQITRSCCHLDAGDGRGEPGDTQRLQSREHEYHQESTIDLMFASQALAPRVPRGEWGIIEVDAFRSDHCLIGATIDIRPLRHLAPRFCWQLDDATSRDLRERVMKSFGRLSTDIILRDEASIEEYAVRCCNALTTPAVQCVPILHPLSRRPLFPLSRRPCVPSTGFSQERLHAPPKFVPSTFRSRRRKFRKTLSTIKLSRLYRLSRGSAKWRKPRPLPHMPSLLEK